MVSSTPSVRKYSGFLPRGRKNYVMFKLGTPEFRKNNSMVMCQKKTSNNNNNNNNKRSNPKMDYDNPLEKKRNNLNGFQKRAVLVYLEIPTRNVNRIAHNVSLWFPKNGLQLSGSSAVSTLIPKY